MTKDRRGELWTVQEDEVLINQFLSGQKLPQLARAFGRTENAICTRLAQHDLLIYIGRTGAYHRIDPHPEERET